MEEDNYPWGEWPFDLEMDDEVNESLCHNNNNTSFDEEFLRYILQESSSATTTTTTTTMELDSNSLLLSAGQNNNIIINSSSNIADHQKTKTTSSSSSASPTTYILSFDKSGGAMLPIIDDHGQNDINIIPIPCSSSTTTTPWKLDHHHQIPKFENQLPAAASSSDLLLLASGTGGRGNYNKKSRSASETIDHIMSERNRRQELTRKFIALSATIPGLKKMDKAHVLREAINYVKQLEKRVKELEEETKKNGVESVITITRSHLCINDHNHVDSSSNSTTTTNNQEYCCYGPTEALPEVEARVLGKELLIKIHCQKQNGILLKIMSHLETLHLSVTTSNVLPFGNTTLDITIIARMSDQYNLTVKDLVKKLRLVLAIQHACDDVQKDVASMSKQGPCCS